MPKPVINWKGTTEEITAGLKARAEYTDSLIPQYILLGSQFPTLEELEADREWDHKRDELKKAFFAERGLDADKRLDLQNEVEQVRYIRVFREWMEVEPQFCDFMEDIIAKRKK